MVNNTSWYNALSLQDWLTTFANICNFQSISRGGWKSNVLTTSKLHNDCNKFPIYVCIVEVMSKIYVMKYNGVVNCS